MEWNRKIEDKLTQNWQWLMRTVMLKEIVHVLIEDKIISLDFWMNLKEKQISEQDRNANFFFEVSKFTKDRYRLFTEALRKGSHNDLAEMLEIKATDDDFKNRKKSVLGPKNERIKKLPKCEKSEKQPELLSKQMRSPSDIKRENSELRNRLTTISSHVGHLHSVTQDLTDTFVPKDATFLAPTAGSVSFVQRIQNIEEHEKYLELQDINLKQEMVIKHLRSEILELKVDLNHQINQLEIKLKDLNMKKELKDHEVDNLIGKITGMKTQIQSITKDLQHERDEKSKLKIESAKLAKLNGELQDKVKEQTTKVVSLENNILQMKSDKDAALSQVKTLQHKLTEKDRFTNEQKQVNIDLRQDLVQEKSKVDGFSKENKKLVNKVSEVEKELVELKFKLHRLEAEKQRGRIKNNLVPTWK